MKGKDLLRDMEHIDPKFVEEASEMTKHVKKKSWNWKQSSMIAACLVLLLGGGWLINATGGKKGSDTGSGMAESNNMQESTNMEDGTINSGEFVRIVEGYPGWNEQQSATECYVTPEKGKVGYSSAIANALEVYKEEEVGYFVRIDVFAEQVVNGEFSMVALFHWENEQELLQAEVERLQEIGYDVEVSEEGRIEGVLSRKQILEFNAAKTYGYMMFFNVEP